MSRLVGQRGWTGEVRYGERRDVLAVRLEAEDAAPITIHVEPVREILDLAAGADESEAELELEWGSGQGTWQSATIDVGRGLTLVLPAVELRARIRNVGAGNDNPPTRTWRVAAAVASSKHAGTPLRAVRVAQLLREEVSAEMFVPAYAYAFTFPRFPAVNAVATFIDGAGREISEHRFPADEDRLTLVTPGADRVRVQCLDDRTLERGRLLFQLGL